MRRYQLLFRRPEDDDPAVIPGEFFAGSDEVALNYTLRVASPAGCELWDGGRFVASVSGRARVSERDGRPLG